MMEQMFIVEPRISGDITVGTSGDDSEVLIGKIAEVGPQCKLMFGGSKEFVAMIVGKRGSGKSHTLGTIVEGFSTTADETTISRHKTRRATLLLDPMGNFWTTAHRVTGDGTEKVKSQYEMLKAWNCDPEEINVNVFLPAGFRTANDPDFIIDFSVNVSDLDAADLADLLGINLMSDPQGAVLGELYYAVTEEGWQGDDGVRRPKSDYGIADLLEYVEYLRSGGGNGDHAVTTLRTLSRKLRSLERQAVFSGDGTPLTQLLEAGKLGILMLPYRIGHDLRRVITRLLIRRILRERCEASQIKQRLDIELLDDETKTRLTSELESRIPRSIIAIDEAQELLGDEGKEARRALEDFCLLGRNYGLSLLLATQRPSAGAISQKVRSQVDLQIIHRLLTSEDIENCRSNLLAVLPDDVRLKDRKLEFPELVRSLGEGQALVSASHARTSDGEIHRVVLCKIRPRVTVHGGEVL